MAYTGRSRYHDVDRGWAWVAMVATYVGMVTFCQVMYMGGVIYLELLGRFRSGEAKTSLVGALNSGVLCLVAPIAGMVITRWSCRVCIVTGGAITTAGFAIGAFMPSLDWMILVVGVVVGIGFSFSSAGIICVAGFYFQKWRDAIVSGAFISVGVAMFSSAPVGLYIFEQYGFVSGFLLIAGIQAHVCIVGMLCHPSALEKQVHTQRKRVRSEKSGFNLLDYLDLTLMKNTAYLLFLFSEAIWACTFSLRHNSQSANLGNMIYTAPAISTGLPALMNTASSAQIESIAESSHRSYYILPCAVELLGAACGAAAIWCRGSVENDLDQDTSITVDERKSVDSDLDQDSIIPVEENKALATDHSNNDTKL